MKVKDVMHKGVTCVEPTTPVKELAKRMRDSDIGAIPVCADGRLVGIVTDRDIICRAVADTGNLGKMTAQDVMTKNVVCCSPEDYIDLAIDVIEANQVRRTIGCRHSSTNDDRRCDHGHDADEAYASRRVVSSHRGR